MARKPVRSHLSLPNDPDADETNFTAIREPLSATSSPAAHDHRDAEPLAWQHRLTAHGKLWRGGLASLVVVIACIVILAHAPLSTLFPPNATANHAAPTPFPVTDLTTFQLTPLPQGASHNLTVTVVPANDPAQTVYACWSAAPLSPTSHMGRVYLAYHHTTDNSYAWTALLLPLVYSDTCTLTIDTINPKGILLSLDTGDSPCALPLLYYSADGGATWAHIGWPAEKVAACDLHMALVGGRLYAWDDASLLPPPPSISLPAGRIITSLLGASGPTPWTLADVGLSDLAVVSVVGVRPGGGLLAMGDLTSDGATRELLASDDYGRTWSREGALPGFFPQVYVSSNPFDVAHGGWGRLYDQAYRTSDSANGQGSFYLATTYLGDSWQQAPLPPLAEAAETHVGAPTIIGVGTGGSLLVMRGAISQPIASPGPPAEHLWLWDSQHQRWLLNRDPTPTNVIGLSTSWTQGEATIWFTVIDTSVEPTIYLLSATFASQPPSAQHVAGG